MISKVGENIDKKVGKKKTEAKSKTPKTKMVNILTLDLEKTQLLLDESYKKQEEKREQLEEKKQLNPINKEETQSINNIDLLYLTKQHKSFKPNIIDSLVNNNYLLKSIYNSLDENINCFKDEIIKYNASNLKELLENNQYCDGKEKHKLYYLLYVLNLIQHLKEKKIQNLICEDLKDYSNNYKTNKEASETNSNSEEFNIINETLKLMKCSTSKTLTNIDLMVTKKSNFTNKKILPQKWE